MEHISSENVHFQSTVTIMHAISLFYFRMAVKKRQKDAFFLQICTSVSFFVPKIKVKTNFILYHMVSLFVCALMYIDETWKVPSTGEILGKVSKENLSIACEVSDKSNGWTCLCVISIHSFWIMSPLRNACCFSQCMFPKIKVLSLFILS